jgi:hypothetical protein
MVIVSAVIGGGQETSLCAARFETMIETTDKALRGAARDTRSAASVKSPLAVGRAFPVLRAAPRQGDR